MMKRRFLLSGTVAAIALPVRAQGPSAIVGWLFIQARDEAQPFLLALQEGLAKQGRVLGETYKIEARYADGVASRLPVLAQELVDARVGVIVATSQPVLDAVRSIRTTIPVVGRMTDDPVQSGAVRSLARPGGTITGVYSLLEETTPKRIELLRAAVPQLSKIGALLTLDRGNTRQWLEGAEAAARGLSLALHVMNVKTPSDLAPQFEAAVGAGVGAVLAFRNPTIVTAARETVDLLQRYRLPAIFDAEEYVRMGALMSYGPNLRAIFERLGALTGLILNGRPVQDVPVEQPTSLDLVINRATARAFNLALPPNLMVQAID